MDVSTFFAAPATAASTAALSFGAMGGAAAQGEGGEGLDSFNQLLGNFLSLTGGVSPEGALLADGTVPAVTDGTMGPILSQGAAGQGAAGLFQGLNLNGLTGNGAQTGKALEGRWAQSGLSLLAGSALAGQELNQEVVAFLNDLSTAISTEGAALDGEISLDVAVESVGEGEEEVATLMLVEGEASAPPLPVPDASLPALMAPTVIPRETAQPATGHLGMTLTVAGTGLQALPTVPASEHVTAPAAAPVIPRLAAAPTAPVAPQAAPLVAVSTVPVDQAPAPVVTTAEAPAMAETAEPLVAVPAAGAPVATAATTNATPVNAAAPTTDKPVVDERVAAIALPAELAATAQADDTPVPVALTTKPAEPAKSAENTAPTVAPAPQVAARLAAAPVAQPFPAKPVTESAPAPAAAPAMTAEAAATDAAPATPATTTPAAPVTITATRAEAQPVAAPAPKVETVKAKPVEGTALPAEAADGAPVETVEVTEAEPTTPAVTHTTTANTAANVTRPATAPVRPVVTPPTHAQAAAGQPAPEAEADAAEAPAEEDEATNNRMLAPRHLGAEAQAEMQDGVAGQAQSAGQNQTGIRDVAPPTVNGEREDNLLARAVTAAGKGSESKTAGDENAGSNPDTGTPAETVDGMTGAAHAGESGKAQGTDFAQSLRQTNAPHRPGAYMPPTQQMAFHVQRAVQDGNDRLSLRLNPQELGRIDVQLEIGAEGKLRAKVIVENPQTLEMLQKDAKHLEKALQDAGLQTDQNSLSFSLQDSGDQARERQEQREQNGHGTGIASEDVEQEDPAIIAQAQIMELGRVDVRV